MPFFKRKREKYFQDPSNYKRYANSLRFPVILRIILLVALLLTITFGVEKLLSSKGQVQETKPESSFSSNGEPLSLNDVIHETQEYLDAVREPKLNLSPESQESTSSTKAFENTSTYVPSFPAVTGKFLVVIDPGHQGKADLSLEPVAPWSSVKKPKVSGGATGARTGIKESSLMLEISQMLRKELEKKGIKVILTREREEVNISNRERALLANSLNADLLLRLHANSSANVGAKGAMALYQQPHPSILEVSEKSKAAAQIILNIYCQTTGMKNLGIREGKDMTGLNWSKVPAIILELGFLSNPDDEYFMVSEEGKTTIIRAISEGIIAYREASY